MGNVRPVAWLLILVTSLAALSTTAAAPAGWLSTHYYEFSELSLGTASPGFAQYPDCAWQGADYVLNVAPDFTPFNCGQAEYVWAPTCKADAQTVEFKKRIWLPGKAAEFQASLVSLNDRPLIFMEIRINDDIVVHTTRSVHKRGLKTQADAFKFGWNVIKVVARKGKTGACNQGGADTGVYAHLHAKFAADLAVSRPKLTFLGNGAVTGTMTVRNHGPSVMTAGSAWFAAFTLNLKKVSDEPNYAILLLGPAIDAETCGYSYESLYFEGKDYSGYRTHCLLKPLDPGESTVITIVYKYLAPAGDFFEQWPIAWRVDSREVTDGKYGNNEGRRLQGACRPAMPPKCVAQ